MKVIQHNVLDQSVVEKIKRIDSVSQHDEYRGHPLPAYKVWLSGEGNLIAYVSARDGSFQRIRHRRWRWFDFL